MIDGEYPVMFYSQSHGVGSWYGDEECNRIRVGPGGNWRPRHQQELPGNQKGHSFSLGCLTRRATGAFLCLMDYLKIAHWKRWQTYRKDRGQPPWIKLHRVLLRNPEWINLTDAQQGHLVNFWLLAADKNGKIPDDSLFLQKVLNLSEKPNLELFIDLAFIEKRRHTRGNLAPHIQNKRQRQRQSRVEKSAASPQTGLATSPIFLLIPTNKNEEEFTVTEEKVREYQKTYPAVDVKGQIRAARQWCIDNPAKKKTLGGVLAFLNRWLAKEQNIGGSHRMETQTPEEHLAEIKARVKP